MKNQKRTQYFVLILIITALIYHQYLGLNLFLISVVSVIYLKINHSQPTTSYWWLSASLWMGSGLAFALNNGYLSPFLYVINGINFYNVAQNPKSQFPFTLLKSVMSFFIGILYSIFPYSFLNPKPEITTNENNKSKTIFKSILTYSIPFVLVIVFLKLYQQANPKFAELTEFLNLEFISWNFILTYIVFYITLNGFYFYYKVDDSLDQLGNNKSNDVDANYSDKIETKFGIKNELKVTKLTVVTLTLLLTAFLIVDALTVFNLIDNNLSHTDNVHQGIFVLITSVIFVIIIVSISFRGQLNFYKDNTLKPLTIFWLILNVVLIGLNTIKNNNYIAEWGLTHKRVGVFVYLILCVIGLLFTIYKIKKNKTFWFLMNKTTLTFMSLLVIYSMLNWNGLIAKYNLSDNRFPPEKIDLYYNLELGYEAYPYLMVYFKKHPMPNNIVHKKFDYLVKNFQPAITQWKEFPSFRLSRYLVYQKLKNYEPLKDNDYAPIRFYD